MGSITRGLSNNITSGGVILPAGITNASVSAVTSFANASGGTLILLSTQTANNSATISFTSGLNSTYDEYQFKLINIHPRTDTARFQFNLSTDSGSNYNVTKTSTFFYAYGAEGGGDGFSYQSTYQLDQSTSDQTLSQDQGSGADEDAGGILTLFNPSSTTYVKHWIFDYNHYHHIDLAFRNIGAGYGNTTSAVNAVRFQFSSGNFDGIIKLYGVKKS
jgi:hypothetical protein